MKNQDSEALRKERLKTNLSLKTEREKADRVVCEIKDLAEIHDLELEKVRTASDEALTLERIDADKATVTMRALHQKIEAERKVADLRLGEERIKADKALLVERERLAAEAKKFSAKERVQTDLHLNEERRKTDLDYQYAAVLLTEERAAHIALKQALTTRDEFLAVLSHDLRSPLSVISMCGQELAIACEENRLTENEAEWVAMINRNCSTMTRLIRDLLDVEHMVSGKIEIHRTRFELRHFIEDVISGIKMLAFAKQIEIKTNFDNKLLEVEADYDRLAQVLNNLLSNAIKFTPDQGKITVSSYLKDDGFYVSVSDTGPGISVEQQPKVFERFSQLGNRDRRGVGLGLYISQWIVEKHGGKIWVESVPRSGSTFTFAIPPPPC